MRCKRLFFFHPVHGTITGLHFVHSWILTTLALFSHHLSPPPPPQKKEEVARLEVARLMREHPETGREDSETSFFFFFPWCFFFSWLLFRYRFANLPFAILHRFVRIVAYTIATVKTELSTSLSQFFPSIAHSFYKILGRAHSFFFIWIQNFNSKMSVPDVAYIGFVEPEGHRNIVRSEMVTIMRK